jgi:hypothetical protein
MNDCKHDYRVSGYNQSIVIFECIHCKGTYEEEQNDFYPIFEIDEYFENEKYE